MFVPEKKNSTKAYLIPLSFLRTSTVLGGSIAGDVGAGALAGAGVLGAGPLGGAMGTTGGEPPFTAKTKTGADRTTTEALVSLVGPSDVDIQADSTTKANGGAGAVIPSVVGTAGDQVLLPMETETETETAVVLVGTNADGTTTTIPTNTIPATTTTPNIPPVLIEGDLSDDQNGSANSGTAEAGDNLLGDVPSVPSVQVQALQELLPSGQVQALRDLLLLAGSGIAATGASATARISGAGAGTDIATGNVDGTFIYLFAALCNIV